HVAVDGVGHTGALCYPCYFPDGFWRRVEQKIREDERYGESRGATDQPTLFEAATDGAATGQRPSL
ncbi:MAG: hypothetical protein L0G70_11875, partial [Rubrobacter sp.]|nr:hypothetical protein [Rubrobacter sp.]